MWPTILSLWLTLSGQAPPRPPRRRPAFRRPSCPPRLEALEDRLTPSLTTLASFNWHTTGTSPEAGLIMDSSGNLYGTTNGQSVTAGTVFELAHGSGTLTALASFNGANGTLPAAALIMDSSGNLYGTAFKGGAFGDGTVFELAHGSSTITALASFNGANGARPLGSLIMDSSGNLYGTTQEGGASNDGTVFELAHGSGTITTLASFNGANGQYPQAGLIMDSGGNLYGTAFQGGDLNSGTVFELAQGSGTITTLASLYGYGQYPEGALIMDSGGNLYGTAFQGGLSYGIVFELAHGSGTITTLASFNGANGQGPEAGLIMDSSGNLYGTTDRGGSADEGTIFEVAHGSGTITTLASFNVANGAGSAGALIMDSSGNLYGTTVGGGLTDDGTVFEFTNGPSFAITGPSGVTAGTAGSFTVTALNADGTVDAGYSGSVQITSSDGKAVLPGDLAISGGTGAFNVTLETAGAQSITATDVSNSSMTGFDAGVAVSPAAASQVVFTQTPSNGIDGQTLGTLEATIEDAYGNVETGDNSDTVTLSVNTGPSTQLGGTPTETVEGGVAAFNNLLLDTSGSYTLAAAANLAGGGTLGPVVSSGIAVARVAAPTVTAVSPSSGPTAGGTTVTITGSNFTGAMAVQFGSVAATSFSVTSATSITAADPAGAAGAVDVTVTTAGGASGASAADQFTYTAAPTAVLMTNGELDLFNSLTGQMQLLSPAGTILSVSAVQSSNGTTDVFAITSGAGDAQFQNTLWEYSAASGWSQLSTGSFAQISAGTNSVGQGVVFGVLTDGSFYEQDPANGTGLNSGFTLLSPSGTIVSVSAVTDLSGNPNVYAIVTGTHNLWQHSPAFAGDGWMEISAGSFQQVSAGLNGAGQAVVYSVVKGGSLWEQNPAVGIGLNAGWTQLSGAPGAPAAFLSAAAGRPNEVFGIAADHTLWEHTAAGFQQISTGSFARISPSETAAQDLAFAALTDGEFWEYDAGLPPGNPWTQLMANGQPVTSVASGSTT